MTKEQIERRFAAIDALPPEELTPEEQQNLAKAQAMDDGSAVSDRKSTRLNSSHDQK